MVDYSADAQAVVKQYQGAVGGLNSDKSPDDAARAFELEGATGVPAQTINSDIPSFEQFHKAQLGQQIINENPDVAGFINAHPLHGQLIHDDLGNLDAYSRAYRRIAPGGSPLLEGAKGFAEGWGPGVIGTEYPNWFNDADKYPHTVANFAPLGIPAEILGRTVRGTLTAAHRAIRALGINAGLDESHATSLANEAAGMLEYQLIKPEMKFFVPKGETIFEYPAEGEILPPEAKPGGLPKPEPPTIEGEAVDLSRRGFLKGVASVAASKAIPGVVGKALEPLHPNAIGYATDFFIDRITGLPLKSRERAIKDLEAFAKSWSQEPTAEAKADLRQQYEDGLITKEEMEDRFGPGMVKAYSDAANLLRSGWTPTPDRSVIEAFAQREADAVRPFLEAGKKPPPGVSDIVDEIEAQQTELSSKATDEVLKARDQTALSQRSPEKMEEFTKSLPKGITRIGIEAFDALGDKALKEFDWIPNLEQKLSQRPSSISVPTNIYIAKIDAEIHKQIAEFVAHGEDMTPAEVKELKEAKAARAEREEPERIKSPAMKVVDDIFEGAHHGEALEKAFEKYGEGAYDAYKEQRGLVKDGFTTTKGRFVDREEALRIAQGQDQLKSRAKGNILTTEDLALQTIRDFSGLNPIYPYADALPFDQVKTLLDMVDRKATPEEFMANPFLQQFEEQQDKLGRGPSADGIRANLPNRTYEIDGQKVGYPEILDRLLARAVAGKTLKHDKIITLVVGPPGAGKSSIINPYAERTGAAVFGSDEVKDVIPEYQGGLGVNVVQRESTILSAQVMDRLMVQGANIVIEKIGNNYQDIVPLVENWKGQGYKVNLIHVWAPMTELAPRIVERFIRTGRYVPLGHVQSIVDQTLPGYQKIKEAINGSAAAYDTSSGFPPRVVEGSGSIIDSVGGGRGQPPPTGGAPTPAEEPPRRKRIFAKAKAFGRTEKEYSAYEDLINQRDREDLQWRLERAQKQANRENAKDWKDEVDRITPEVRDEIEAHSEIQAYRFFQDGVEVAGKEVKLRIKEDSLTDEQKAIFPKRFVVKRGGYTPDNIANLVGLESGDDLIATVSSLEREAAAGRGDIVDRLVKAEVNRRVQAKLGETAEERLDEVYDHALSITQLEQLHEQMVRLGTQVGTEISIPPMATKLGALNLLHQEIFGGMSSARYLRDSGRMSRNVEKALLKDDPVEAFKSAQAQYIAAEMAKEARQVEKEKKVFDRLAKRYQKREVLGADPEYTNWIHDLLSRIDEGKRSRADIDTEIGASPYKTLQSFLDSKTAMGREIYIPEFLLDSTFSKSLEDMTVLEARQTMSALRSLAKNSREENRLEVQGQKIDKKDLLDQMTEKLEALRPATVVEHQPGPWNKVRSLGRTYLAITLQVESILNRWDKANAFGIFNQWVGRPLIEAANSEAALQREIAKDYKELPGQLTRGELNRPIPNRLFRDPGDAWQSEGKYDFSNAEPIPLTRKHLRAILLNVGNPSNLKKLADGYQIKPEQVIDWLNTSATKEDWDWAQAHGDMFEKLKRLSDTMYRNLSGVAPESVPLEPIQTRFGPYKGWYHPLIYDPIWRGERMAPAKPKDLFEPEFFRANTPASYTKARTNYVAPLDLSLDQVPSRLTQEIHDISFHTPVVQASKILYDSRFLNAVTKYYGRTYSDLFVPWLKDIANAKNYTSANQAAAAQWMTWVRSNMVGTFVGLNPGTIEKHTVTALANSIKEVGGREFLDAAASLYNDNGRGETNWAFAMRTFDELQRRHQNFMETVSGAQETALGESTVRQRMLQFGTKPVAFFDLLSAVPTALAAYKTVLDEGRSLGDAVYAGNRAVRRAHGSTAITSRPAIMRDYPNVAFLYNFMSRMAQYQYEYAWKARDTLTGKAEGKGAEWTKDVMLGLFVSVFFVGLVDTLVSDLDDKDTWESLAGKSLATGIAAPWIGAREAMHAMTHKSDPMLGAGSSELKILTDAFRDINRGDLGLSKERAGRTVKHFNNAIGLATGLTNSEVGNLAEFIIDLNSGKAKPRTVRDWWRGIRRGRIDKPTSEELALKLIEGGRR